MLSIFSKTYFLQHVEFFHKEHFESNYERQLPPPGLQPFVDFFWQTRFDALWPLYPEGFSDTLFPNTGYTYLFNLGTPFVIQVGEHRFPMKIDGLLPRHKALECFHSKGNCLFGIKFKVSPVMFEKKVNFSEYKDFLHPLSYLANKQLVADIKTAGSFKDRVNLVVNNFEAIVNRYTGTLKPVTIVTEILAHIEETKDFSTPIEVYAEKYVVTVRTLQRYFEATTGIATKKALQILRIRSATEHIANHPQSFHYSKYGYYDHSHFYKHLKQFLAQPALKHIQPHLHLLKQIHKNAQDEVMK